MPFSPAVFRRSALLLLALALWLLPQLPRAQASRPTFAKLPTTSLPTTATAPASAPSAPAPVSVASSSTSTPPPADSVFTLAGGTGSARPYAVALDELYLSNPARIVTIPAQASLAALLAHASTFPSSASVPAPRLVLYPIGSPRNATTRRIVTPALDVQLASASAPTPAPRPDLGIVSWSRPAYAPSHAVARIVGDPAQPLRAAASLVHTPGMLSVRPLLARRHSKKFVPNDPLFKDQWHLRNTGQQSGKSGMDIRAVPAWDTATGSGVVIGVIDDGLDRLHPDLAPAYSADLSYDFNDLDSDPSPVATGEEGDNHGTAVAGLAAARGNNSLGLAGSAPAATLAGLRLLGAETTDETDAEAMAWRTDAIAIKNNSWGPPDAYADYGIPPDLYPAQPLWLAAIQSAVTTGRSGLGTLFVWSAGNGQAEGDQGPKDGNSSFRGVIPVAAVTNRGAPAEFSEGGPHLVVAAPGDARIGLATTDRSGDAGYNSYEFGCPGDYFSEIDYTKSFVGSSAAAPVAAGALAVLLQSRPDLGWRDVKELLLRTSTPLLPTSPEWTTRPAGDPVRPIRHHPRLGGGLLNALDLVTLARTWVPLPPETSFSVALPLSAPAAIPEASVSRPVFSATFTLPADVPVLRVEHVELTLDITHPYRGDLELTLTSPVGTVSTFATPSLLDSGADYKDATGEAGYVFTSVRHWGEASRLPSSPTAAWTLRIRDHNATGSHAGFLHAARLTLYGTPLTAPSVTAPLADKSLATGSTLILRPAFSGGNLTYQWTRDGKPIPGATSPTLRLENFSARLSGAYTCTATNPLGTAISSAAVSRNDSPRDTLVTRAGANTDLALDTGSAPRAWKASGLPSGLRIDPATGRLSGRAAKPGSYPIIVSASDAVGLVSVTPLTLVVSPLPTRFTDSYEGLVSRDQTLNARLGGEFTVTHSAAGTVTGNLRLGTALLPFSGQLDGQLDQAPTLRTRIIRSKLPALELTLNYSDDGKSVTGSIKATGTDTSVALDGRRRAAPVTPTTTTLLQRSALRCHFYEFQPSGQLPEGYTPGFIGIGLDGRVNWKIHPADGSPAATGSTFLSDDRTLFLHVPTSPGLGSLQGKIVFGQDGYGNYTTDTSLDWFRLPSPKLARPQGFGPSPINLRVNLLGVLESVNGKPIFIKYGPAYLKLLGLPRPDLALENPALGLYPGDLANLQFDVLPANKFKPLPNRLKPTANIELKNTFITGKLTLTYRKPGSTSATLTRDVPYTLIFADFSPPSANGFIVLPPPPGSDQAPLSVPVSFP